MHPFTRPLPIPLRCGWRGGLRCEPTWRYWPAPNAVDTAGLHALLRASGLPREELLHMGASRELLSSSARATTYCEYAAPLLGRIAWDHIYGNVGHIYASAFRQQALVLGARVLREWFS